LQGVVPLREPPSYVEVARLLAAVRGWIIRLLRRHHIDLESPVLAHLCPQLESE
jgi:hypothetical protein